MARISTAKRTISLGNSVQRRLASIKAARDAYEMEQERRFQTAVQTTDMSIADQLEYRMEQLRIQQGSVTGNAEYISELKEDIATLKKAERAQRLAEEYYKSYDEWVTGKKPLSFHIAYLRETLGKVNDPQLKSDFQKSLSQALSDEKKMNEAILDNYVTFATEDKSETVLSDALSRITKAKAKAIAGGDNERLSVLELKEQLLHQSMASVRVQRGAHEMEIERMHSEHPLKSLDKYDELAGKANASNPVVIDGIRYASEREFWNRQRNTYILEGQFARDYQNYYTNWVSNTVNRAPELAPSILSQVHDSTELMLTRPELRGQEEYVRALETGVLSKAAQSMAMKYLDDAQTAHTFEYAAKKLDELAAVTGLDVSAYRNQLIRTVSEVSEPAISAVIAEAQYLFNQGMSFNEAMSAATEKYQKGEIFAKPVSAKEIAEKGPEKVIEEFAAEEKPEFPKVAEAAPKREPGEVPGLETKPMEKTFVEPPPIEEKPVEAPKQATLIQRQTGQSRIVEVDSDEARQAFSEGFELPETLEKERSENEKSGIT